MPLRKSRSRQASVPSNVASSSNASIASLPLSSPLSVPLGYASKADQAAMLAQQLGSQSSWADQFLPEMPDTSPTESRLSSISTNEQQLELTGTSRSPALTRTATAATPPTPQSVASDGLTTQNIPAADLPPAYDVVMCSPSDTPAGPLAIISAAEPTFSSKTPIEPVRTYTLNESYKSISGTFTFYDYLELSSAAGSISVVLDPQPGDKSAVLRVNAKYGSIKITVTDDYIKRMEKTSVMPRSWDVVITANTGSVNTKLPIGQGSIYHIEAQTGSIKSTFYAASVGRNDEISKITTVSHTGSQKISVESCQGKFPITNIAAQHHAKSHGSLKINYPKTWQGKLHAVTSGYGSVKVSGDGMEHTHFGDKEKHSWRGEGEQIEVLCDGHGGAKIDCSS